jgi:hypothetical protein
VRVFLLDLWLDLREKRLAPVAGLLLAGLIAIPLVLAKKEKAPPAPATPVAQTPTPITPVVSAAQQGSVKSHLDVFDPKDPFAAPAAATAGGAASGTTGAAGTTGGASSGTSGTTPGTTGGATTGTGTTGTGTGTTTTTTTTQRIVTFTVDLRFGQVGEEKTFKDVHRLDLIPSANDPQIVFLGVTTSGKTAVFLVSSDFTTSGEGSCKPSRDECTFLYLRDDKEHDTATFTASDGTRYRLRLTDIQQVAVNSAVQQERTNRDQSGSGNNAPAFTGSASPPGEPVSGDEARRPSFFQPAFSDVQSGDETTTTGDGSG